MPPSSSLSQRQTAWALWSAGKSQGEAARAVGVSRQTVCLWKKRDQWTRDRDPYAGEGGQAGHTKATSPPSVMSPPTVDRPHQPSSMRTIGPHPALSPPQHVALRAMLRGADYTEAAQLAGVERSTLWRWRHEDADFQAAYAEELERLYAGDREKLEVARGLALDKLITFARTQDVNGGNGYIFLSVLDRAGLPATREVRQVTPKATDSRFANLSTDELRQHLRVLKGGRDG